MDTLIATLDEYLVKKAPFALPDGVKEFIVRFGPWISLVLLVLSLPVFGVFRAVNSRLFTISETHTFSPRLLSTARSMPSLRAMTSSDLGLKSFQNASRIAFQPARPPLMWSSEAKRRAM